MSGHVIAATSHSAPVIKEHPPAADESVNQLTKVSDEGRQLTRVSHKLLGRERAGTPAEDAAAAIEPLPRRKIESALLAAAVPVGAALALMLAPAQADAAAYAKAVYAPKDKGSYLEAWADLSRNCSGTYGCWNYMKIERRRWYGPQFVGGRWANANGWNRVTVTQPYGCYDYRTTVNSYNDVAGSYGRGVNVGPVGWTSSGTRIYRYRSTWSSGYRRYCR